MAEPCNRYRRKGGQWLSPSALAQDNLRVSVRLPGFGSVHVDFVPTPAGWPKGGTFFASGGPCLSLASWAALQRVRVPPLSEGQTGRPWFLTTFTETKSLS